jgi:predicted PurR-regulated permease PerM
VARQPDLDDRHACHQSLGADQTQSVEESIQKAIPEIRKTLVSGVANGIQGLTSLVFFLSFATLATFFVLKDAPVMKAFVNRHLGLPVASAEVVTGRIADSFRHYFGGPTIIAAFNGAVVGHRHRDPVRQRRASEHPAAIRLGCDALNPLAVLVVTIGAGCLFGLVGLTLAAPLTSAAVHISGELRARDRQATAATDPAQAPDDGRQPAPT